MPHDCFPLKIFTCAGFRHHRSVYALRLLLEVKASLNLRRVDGTLLAERLEPSTAVELGVVADELAIVSYGESVDTDDGQGSGCDGPSPGDGVTVEPHVQGLDSDLGLTSLAVLWGIENSLVGESGATKLKQIRQ